MVRYWLRYRSHSSAYGIYTEFLLADAHITVLWFLFGKKRDAVVNYRISMLDMYNEHIRTVRKKLADETGIDR